MWTVNVSGISESVWEPSAWLLASLVCFFLSFYADVVMSAVTSAAVVLTCTHHYFKQQVTVGQMLLCFFTAPWLYWMWCGS